MGNELKFLDSKRFKKEFQEHPDSISSYGVRKHFVAEEIKGSDKEDDKSRILNFTVSTGSVDRDKDVLDPNGFELDNFRKAPVVLFAHDNTRPPVARAVNIGVSQGKLKASAEFMDTDIDTSGFSDMIYRMLKGGFLQGTSVGFLPIEFEQETEDETRKGGLNFSKQELLEFSIVPVPANPEALIEAKAKGINTEPLHTWLEEVLDDWVDYKDLLLIPRNAVEKFYTASDNKISKTKKKTGVHNLSNAQQDDLLQRNLKNAIFNRMVEQIRSGEEIVIDENNIEAFKDYTSDVKFEDEIVVNAEENNGQTFYHISIGRDLIDDIAKDLIDEQLDELLEDEEVINALSSDLDMEIQPEMVTPDVTIPEKAEKSVSKSISALPRIASRIYDTPLLIHQPKLNTILSVLGDRINFDVASLAEEELDTKPREARKYSVNSDGIAVIPVIGSLIQRSIGMDAISGLSSYKSIEDSFLQALSDPDVKAIALEIDSPGGEANAVFDLSDTIYRSRGVKPIWSIVNESAYSAAYAIASAADKVFVPRTGGVGSIGVIAVHADRSVANHQSGLNYTIINAGDKKADGNDMQPLSDRALGDIQKGVDRLYDMFVKQVARNRNLSEDEVRATEAGVYDSDEAVLLGLADEISSTRETFVKMASMVKEAVTKNFDDDGFFVQTLIFPKSHWASEDEVIDWTLSNDYVVDEVVETETEFKVEQDDSTNFKDLSTVCLDPTNISADDEDCSIKAIGGALVEKSEDNLPEQETVFVITEKIGNTEITFSGPTQKDCVELLDLYKQKNSVNLRETEEETDMVEIEVTEKQSPNSAQLNFTAQELSELLDQVLPSIVKEVMSEEISKVTGRVKANKTFIRK